MLIVRMAFNADGKDSERAAHVAAHAAHLRSNAALVVQSGPLFDGDERVGALVVFSASSFAEVEAFNAADPFIVHGVYDRISLMRWDRTIG